VRSGVFASFAGLAVVVSFSLSPRDACAQDRQDSLQSRHKMYQSPQNFAAELRLGPYYPDVDSDPALKPVVPPNANPSMDCQTSTSGPLATSFGTSKRFMLGGEFDWQALRIPHLGTIGPGVAIGYTHLSGNATFVTPHVTASGSTCQSGESTSLTIVPVYVMGVLRADVLWRELRIPLVPYVKAGLGDAFWRASNSLGTSTFNGVTGEGHTYGAEFAAGLALNLNIFDENAARSFDETSGVNNTYAFAEYIWSDFQGLGLQTDPLRLGDSTWVIGLAWEF
jgi:hypothetical protein